MFKKTLLALALTGMTGTAVAGTVNANGSLDDGVKSVSVEGAVGSSSVRLSGVDFVINNAKKADYSSLSKIVVDISGATLAPSTDGAIVLDSTGADTVTATVAYPTAKRAVFTLTDTDADDFSAMPDNAKFTINNLDLVFDSMDAGSEVTFTVTAQSTVGNSTIDSGSETVTKFVKQFSAKVDPTLGSTKIDVAAARKLFAGDVKTDTTTATISSPAADLLTATVVADSYEYTLNGDFSFLDVDGDDKIDEEFTLTGTAAKGLQSTVIESNSATGKFDFATDGSVVLPVQGYSIDASVQYTTAAGATQTFDAKGLSAGAWSLNGTSKDITFMPFGNAYAQSITVTNRGTVVGEIEVVLTYNGENYTKALTAVAAAKTVTDISKEVAAFAAESGVVGNANVKVIVNSPSVDVDAVYYSKADADRVKTF